MEPDQNSDERDQPTFHIEEAELKASEPAFRLLADAFPEIIWTSDPGGRIDYYNQPFYDFTGYARENFRFRYWAQIMHPDDQQHTLDVWYRSMQTGTPYELEYRVWCRKLQRYCWFLVRAAPLRNAEGQVIKWFGIGTNIDERKRAEEKLLFHASLARSIQDAVVVSDLESSIISWNKAAEAIYGWNAEEVMGKSFSKIAHTQYSTPTGKRDEWLKIVLAQGYWVGEVRQQRRDGAWLHVHMGVSIFKDADGNAVGLAGVMRDITQRKLEEERKDTFIGMAGHELKTPLTTIKGFVQLLKRQLQRLGLKEQTATLGKIEKQVDTLAELVNELMDVSKIEMGMLHYNWEEIDVDALIKHVVEIVRVTSHQHTIVINGASHCMIVGDSAHLIQVLTNLLTNAIKYSPQARRVDVLLSRTEHSVLISVRDYGIGIAQAEQEHIFERFYRSSTAWSQAISGLGMGLYIAQEIMKQHKGQISVESKEEEGTTFTLELPFSQQGDETPR